MCYKCHKCHTCHTCRNSLLIHLSRYQDGYTSRCLWPYIARFFFNEIHILSLGIHGPNSTLFYSILLYYVLFYSIVLHCIVFMAAILMRFGPDTVYLSISSKIPKLLSVGQDGNNVEFRNGCPTVDRSGKFGASLFWHDVQQP